MDCEKYESAMMDELYGELDELTSAAAKRHVAGCARCTALAGGLRATRRVAAIALVEPPADLEERILAAVREAQKVVPLRGRVARVVSLAGSWAMRPQTAMAALFLVMIGTSVLLLRGQSSRAPPSAAVTVTEQGAPAPEPAAAPTATTATVDTKAAFAAASAAPVARAADPKAGLPPAAGEQGDDLRSGRSHAGPGGKEARDKDEEAQNNMVNAAPPAGAPPPPPAQVAGGAGFGGAQQSAQSGALSNDQSQKGDVSPFDAALQSYRAGRFDDAARAFDALAAADPNAELWGARSVRESKGCRNAVARFDKVAQRARSSPPGWDALLEGALCYRAIGDFGNARVRLTALLNVDSHKDRARAELDRINQLQQAQGTTTPPAAAARPSPRKAAPNATADVQSGF